MSCSVGCAVKKIPQGLAKRARAILLLGDGLSFTQTSLQVGMGERHLRSGQDDLLNEALKDCMTVNDREESRFSPQVALYLVKIACERPDTIGRSLSQWDCGISTSTSCCWSSIAFLLQRLGASCRVISSSHGSITCGYRLKCQEIAPLPNRFKKLATCTLGNWSDTKS